MKEFTIFDVGHGSCALAVAENGEAILVDCGHKTIPESRPSQLLPAQGIRRLAHLFVTNFDEDHVSDLPQLRRVLDFSSTHFHRNREIDVPLLTAVKLQSGPLTPAMSEALSMHEEFVHPTPVLPTPGLSWQVFSNSYPEFADTNNLSLVVFLHVGGLTILLPGDLETAGWRALLRQPSFRTALGSVNIFVASHHGRESGYCPEVFQNCAPDVVVFSDSPISHATQRMAATYGQHAKGTPLDGEPRSVLTTRQDGTLTWNPG